MAANPTERAKNSAIRFALQMGKRPRFAGGGVVGPLSGLSGGRTDTLPISVPEGSYVIPADIVSGLPGAEGNSIAGHNALAKLFSAMPYVPDRAPYGVSSPKIAAHKPNFGKAKGGRSHSRGRGDGKVDIMAAPGEYVVDPETVKRIGKGDTDLGHEILDEFVKEVRKRNIRDLKKLPPPVKN